MLHTISTLEIRAIYPKHETDIGIRKGHKRLSKDWYYATYMIKWFVLSKRSDVINSNIL